MTETGRLGARVGAALLLGLGLLATPACGDDDPPYPPTYDCRNDGDCPPGRDCCDRDDCPYRVCVIHCDEHWECPGGRCQHHMCY